MSDQIMFNDCVLLEMRMAEIMTQQEQSGFKFDVSAAERVRNELQAEASKLEDQIKSKFLFVPGKVYVPKRC
jgi:DNA polymerase I-like protein with 3'-5' exonuclease and polymerase domains